MYIYIYICIYLYLYLYLVRHGNRQDILFGSRRRHHPTFFFMVSIVGSFMVSVVAGNICSWFPSLVVLWFPSWQENVFVMVSVARCLVDSATAGGSTNLECFERFLVFCAFRTGFRRSLFVMVSVVAATHCFYGFRRWMVSVVARNFCHGFRLLQDRGCLSDENH